MEGGKLWSAVLLISVSTASALQVSIPHSTYEVARGDEVAITCSFQPKNPVNNLIIISWTGDPDESFDDEGITFGTYYSNDGHVDIDPMYEGKAQIQSDVNARTSKLVLQQVTLRESRRIRCRVQIPADTEGQTSDSTTVVVLVAPSPPICKIKGAATYGQNINLTCFSEEGSPPPVYQWKDYNFQDVLRPFPPKTIEKDGVLSLFNISRETSGYFICTSTNKIRSTQCNLTLSVMPSSMNIGATAGIIGGAVAGVAVLVLIIYCCCKSKDKPEEYDMGSPEIEYHDAPQGEERDEGLKDLRKTSIEGTIDRSERYEVRTEAGLSLKGSEEDERKSNQRLDYRDSREDEQRERYDDRRDHRERYDDRRDRYDDRPDRYDDRPDRYDDRRDRYDDRPDRYDDRRDRYDDRPDRYDDRRDRYDDRPDRYDDRRDRYDDRRDRYDDRDDHRGRYDGQDRRYRV